MKKVFLSLMLVAFAVSVQAGEGKECSKSTACASGAKKVSAEAKAQCPAEAKKANMAKSGCCPSGATAKQTLAKVESPKAAEQVRR